MVFVEQREDIIFVAFGKENAKDGSYVVEEGQSLIGTVVSIRDSQTYQKIYTLQVKDVPKPLLITGKRALVEAMGHGTRVVPPVKEGDLVKITYLGKIKTNKGKSAYNFKVEVDRS